MAHKCADQHIGCLILIGPEGSVTAGAAARLWFHSEYNRQHSASLCQGCPYAWSVPVAQ